MKEKVRCIVCGKILTSKDALTHMQKTDHNLWELLLEPPHELILECCGKPESECRCEEPKPDEDIEKVKAILEDETTGGYLHNFADFKRVAPPEVVEDYIYLLTTQIVECCGNPESQRRGREIEL